MGDFMSIGLALSGGGVKGCSKERRHEWSA